MSIRTSRWPAGVPCWADISVPDVAAAGAFYSAVLGWEVAEPDPQYGGYVVARVRGAAAAGLSPPMQPGAPAAWTLYFASDDADATAAAVVEHGGTLLQPPGDVGPLGRMFIAADPTGAVFGVWQALEFIGAGIVNEPGGLIWEDLRSTDPDRARAFYTAVFGFRTEPMPMAGPDYTTFAPAVSGDPLGGMGGMMGHDDHPSYWLVYFCVPDVDAAVAAAVGAGGTAQGPAFDTDWGRMGPVADPFGVPFWLVQASADGIPDWSE